MHKFIKIIGQAITGIILFIVTINLQQSDAQEIVDVELILALDCSYSVDDKEYRLQTYGIAQALRNPEIIRAIRAGPYQSIAISIVQWSNENSQTLALPWYRINNEQSAHNLANLVQNLARQTRPGSTSLSGAIQYSMRAFQQSPYQGIKQIIDISGDGRNNNGQDMASVRYAALALGITINGLPILTDDPTLDFYYKNKVITGPGSFVIKAKNYSDYVTAIERKILKEVKYYPIGAAPAEIKSPYKQVANISLAK